MSLQLFKAACQFRKNGELVPFDKLVNTPTLLLEVATDYNRIKTAGPTRTWKEVQAELIKINGHWTDLKEREEDMSFSIQHTEFWINDSHKDEDIFMPSDWAKKAASSKSKEVASSKPKRGACKGKEPATSKIDDGDFMPTTKANKAASTKGKRVAKP
jgi:hypothetical protein